MKNMDAYIHGQIIFAKCIKETKYRKCNLFNKMVA